MHAIWDCRFAKEVCECLIPPDLVNEFFSLDLSGWVHWLLRIGFARREIPRWPGRMIMVFWLQWKWRNDEVFSGVHLDLQQTQTCWIKLCGGLNCSED